MSVFTTLITGTL